MHEHTGAQVPSRAARGVARALGGFNATAFAALTLVLLDPPVAVVAAWPWPELPMSFVFLASIAASIAAVWATIAWRAEVAAVAGIGLNTLVAGGGAALYLGLQLHATGRGALAAMAGVATATALFGAVLWGWARRAPAVDPRPLPALVRHAFVAFSLTLVVAGGALAAQRQVFPWPLQPGTATLFGCIFLGAAAYFGHAAAARRWAAAEPLLWGFLAYDLVLFVPYGRLLAEGHIVTDGFYGSSAPVNVTSLAIYLAVLGASALLALHTMLIAPATRCWGRAAPPAA